MQFVYRDSPSPIMQQYESTGNLFLDQYHFPSFP